MKWGGFGLVAEKTYFKLPANPYAYHTVVQSDTFAAMDPDTLIGLIIPRFGWATNDVLTVYSGDANSPLKFEKMGGLDNMKRPLGWLSRNGTTLRR